MKTFTAVSTIAAVGIAAVTYVKAQATVQSPPTLIQCQPAAIAWSGATGTVYLSVVEGDDVSSPAYITFPEQSGASGSYTWPQVNISSGTTITFIVNDGTGQPNYSSQVTINPGSDDSCLSGSSSSGSGSGSSSSADDDSSSTSSAASSSAGGVSTRASSAASSASSRAASGTSGAASSASSAASTGSSSGAAAGLSFNMNAVAVVGAAFAGAAFLA